MTVTLEKIGVNEIFTTIQGEAKYTGTPSVFIRLMGCDVGCPWCDTKHTWIRYEDTKRSPIQIAGKKQSSTTWAEMTAGEILSAARITGVRHVVITGGEPCMYNLFPLTEALVASDMHPQIETSGTYEIKAHGLTWVTVSPKIDMPGGRELLASSMWRADEVKWPVGKVADIERIVNHRHMTREGVTHWLQPLSESEKATELCVEASIKHGFKVSMQTHKAMGIR